MSEAKLYEILRSRNYACAEFVEMENPNGDAWFWTGMGNIEYPDSTGVVRTWLGCGVLGEIDLPEENGEVSVSEIVLSLDGISPEYEYLIEDPVRGHPVKIWKAFLDDNYRVQYADIVEDGVQDYAESIQNDDGTIRLVVHCLGKFGYLARQNVRRTTPELLKRIAADEGADPNLVTGADSIASIANANLAWFRP